MVWIGNVEFDGSVASADIYVAGLRIYIRVGEQSGVVEFELSLRKALDAVEKDISGKRRGYKSRRTRECYLTADFL